MDDIEALSPDGYPLSPPTHSVASLVTVIGIGFIALVALRDLSSDRAATLIRELETGSQWFYGLLVILLAVRFPIWTDKWRRDPAARGLLGWLLFGFGLALAVALFSEGRSVLYLLLVGLEGLLILAGYHRHWSRLWFGACLAVILTLVALFTSLAEAGSWLIIYAPLILAAAGGLELFNAEWRASSRQEAERTEVVMDFPPQSYSDYISRVEALAVARERTRIAREFHDTLGHTLTALDVQMELIARLPAEQVEVIQQAAQQARNLVKEGLTDVRRSIQALYPTALESFSAIEAIESLVADFQATTHIETQWQVEGKVALLPPHLTLALYRSAQEALTNVRRHAHPQSVLVKLTFATDAVTLLVENDGATDGESGHESDHESDHGFGLKGIRERAEELYGRVVAGPSPQGGFRVEVSLPR